MKKIILSLTLALLAVISLGVRAGNVDQPSELKVQVEASTAETAAEADLVELFGTPEANTAGACCWAECLEERVACLAACNYQYPCGQQCWDAADRCTRNC